VTKPCESSVEQIEYFSYLLRLWRVTECSDTLRTCRQTAWRASLQSSRTGEQQGFASLNELFAFLRRQTGAVSDTDEDERKARA
jgi:hypothetical protein